MGFLGGCGGANEIGVIAINQMLGGYRALGKVTYAMHHDTTASETVDYLNVGAHAVTPHGLFCCIAVQCNGQMIRVMPMCLLTLRNLRGS